MHSLFKFTDFLVPALAFYIFLEIYSFHHLKIFSCFFLNLFIWLHWLFVAAYEIFSYGIRDLVPWPRLESGPSTLGTESPSPWTTREVLSFFKE